MQLVSYALTLSSLFVFKSVFISNEKEQGIHMLCELNIDLVPPEELNLFEVSQSHLQAPFPLKCEKCNAP